MNMFGKSTRNNSSTPHGNNGSDSALSKRKLENAAATVGGVVFTEAPCTVLSMDDQCKVRKRGSSVASTDGTPMKRSLSDGIINSRISANDYAAGPEEIEDDAQSCSNDGKMPRNIAALAPIFAHESFLAYPHFSPFSRSSVPSIPEQSPMQNSFSFDQVTASPAHARRASAPSSPSEDSPSDVIGLQLDAPTSISAGKSYPNDLRCPPQAKKGWQQPRRPRNPGNLSLDLSQMSSPRFDSAVAKVGMRRNEQAAICSRVTDFLFIGGAAAAKDSDNLMALGITHIINCAATIAPSLFPNEFVYYNIHLRDHASQDIARYFYNVVDFIERARRRGGRIFVHCVKGISRSPTIAIAYLMWYKSIDVYKALEFVRQARPAVDPNAGFIFQLTEWAQVRDGGKLKLERPIIFRIDVSTEDSSPSNGNGNGNGKSKPLIVGPLGSTTEADFLSPSKEIAQACFIVSYTDYMFVWSGDAVSEAHLDAAYQAAALLQQYESFPETYEVVAQGHECAAFWNVLETLHPQKNA